MLSHSGERKFKCGTCSYATNSKGNLEIHELRHSEECKF